MSRNFSMVKIIKKQWYIQSYSFVEVLVHYIINQDKKMDAKLHINLTKHLLKSINL